MEQSHIQELVLSVRELSVWPELTQFVERGLENSSSFPCWEYAFLSGRACGASSEECHTAAAAIFCLLQAIHLVDDLLDEDPHGLQHDLGVGAVANMALALQAAASRIVEERVEDVAARSRIHADLARASTATSLGQYYDSASDVEPSEEAYWRIAESKTPPLFETALTIGAILAGAGEETARRLRRIGFLIGRSIQVSDDLRDALQTPASPDWRSRRNNLALVFAICGDYAEKERFLSLAEAVDDPQKLRAAQEILVRSGAMSYCVFRMVEMLREIREEILAVEIAEPEELRAILRRHVAPLDHLFQTLGAPSTEELLQA